MQYHFAFSKKKKDCTTKTSLLKLLVKSGLKGSFKYFFFCLVDKSWLHVVNRASEASSRFEKFSL